MWCNSVCRRHRRIRRSPGRGDRLIDFVKLVTAWAIDAAGASAATATDPDAFYQSLTVTPDMIIALIGRDEPPVVGLLQAAKANPSMAPTLSDITTFLSGNSFTVGTLAADTHVGFFPMLPACAISGSVDGAAPVPVTPEPDVQGHVLRDYVLLIALDVLDRLGKALGTTASATLYDLYAQLGQDGLSDATALTTRFMLHGTRVDSGTTALYHATGQQVELAVAARQSLAITVSAINSGAWGLVFPAGNIVLSDVPPQTQLWAASQIAGFVTAVSETGVAGGAMPTLAAAPRGFSVLAGVPGTAASIHRLPNALRSLLANTPPASLPSDFALYQAMGKDTPDPVVPPSTYDWCAGVAFDVRKVADPQKAGSFLPNVYALAGVRSDGDRSAGGDLSRPDREAGGAGAEDDRAGLYADCRRDDEPDAGSSSDGQRVPVPEQHFDREQSAAADRHAACDDGGAQGDRGIDPKLLFIAKLMTGGLTNSGGYYLYVDVAGAGLPDALFNARGIATIDLVVAFDNASLFAACTAVRVTGAQQDKLYVAAPDLVVQHALLVPGKVGVQVTRPLPNGDDTKYQLSLDNLFNLVAFAPQQIVPAQGAAIPVNLPVPPVTGPLKTDDPNTLVYNYTFDLATLAGATCPPGSLDPNCSPYRFVGGQLSSATPGSIYTAIGWRRGSRTTRWGSTILTRCVG